MRVRWITTKQGRFALPMELLELTTCDRRLVRRHPKPFAKRDRQRRQARRFKAACVWNLKPQRRPL